ncbi:MAG: RNase adapter RapZ [Bryobacterales bacterium]|nr:RNase adapter RapZ [Bryobacteraceae bacterium]MDW8353668.1 RNase adapter RapZ [Bryobacterales bacterium]
MGSRQRARPASSPELVIITGLSGSGKGTVLKCLEDLGYYAVDNLPVELIPKFTELLHGSSDIQRAALVVDIREREGFQRFPEIYSKIREQLPTTLVFLEADDETLVRRFSETRRPHPLGTSDSILTSIRRERRRLARIRSLADHILNTSKFTVHELRELVAERFRSEREESRILIYVTSFGYRYGLPPDSDLVFDVRFLPNPNYIPRYKKLTGAHPSVARYIRSFPQTKEFLDRITQLLVYLLPHYIREGKSYLTIAFGCTGGRHRSVMIASEIHRRLERAGYRVKVNHRDVAKA